MSVPASIVLLTGTLYVIAAGVLVTLTDATLVPIGFVLSGAWLVVTALLMPAPRRRTTWGKS